MGNVFITIKFVHFAYLHIYTFNERLPKKSTLDRFSLNFIISFQFIGEKNQNGATRGFGQVDYWLLASHIWMFLWTIVSTMCHIRNEWHWCFSLLHWFDFVVLNSHHFSLITGFVDVLVQYYDSCSTFSNWSVY